MRIKALTIALLLSTSAQAQFEKDKQAHLFAGMATASMSMHLNEKVLEDNKIHPIFVSVGSSAIIGTVKELSDSTQKHNRFDALDLGYTVLGGLISYGLYEVGLPHWVGLGIGIGGLGIVVNF